MDDEALHFGPKRIDSIRFGMFSGDEIKSLAVVEVSESGLYDEHLRPIPGGLMDLRMVKIAESGSTSLRLMKALEDLSISFDLTVRDASGEVIQFLYGDDGMDPMQIKGKDSSPLNFEGLFMKIKATYPWRNGCALTQTEILQTVDERLSKNDKSLVDGCSPAFKESLYEFLLDVASSSVKSRKDLKLEENHVGSGRDNVSESIAALISGISREQLEVFLETCISHYHFKKVEPGSAIGAQSIGDLVSHMTLKTFSFAGVAGMNVTLGVPRIKEILNASKEISTPIITAELDPTEYLQAALDVRNTIKKTVLGEVAESIEIVILSYSLYIYVVLDSNISKTLGISVENVRDSILHHPKIKLEPEDVHVLGDHELRISSTVEDIYTVEAMIPKVIVKGNSTAKRVLVNSKKENCYNLLVDGTNLLAVLGSPGVDAKKTKSNHIMEVQQTLGIEAARQSIVNEIQYTMKNHGMTVDVRHMMFFADLMTYKGEVLGITSFDISKRKDSGLILASFEKPAEHLFNASFTARENQIQGVSECIIMGIPMELGTGMFKVR